MTVGLLKLKAFAPSVRRWIIRKLIKFPRIAMAALEPTLAENQNHSNQHLFPDENQKAGVGIVSAVTQGEILQLISKPGWPDSWFSRQPSGNQPPRSAVMQMASCAAVFRTGLNPLFRRYFFTRFDRTDYSWTTILHLPGVRRIISSTLGYPIAVPDSVIEAIKGRAHANGCLYPTTPASATRLAPGTRVKPVAGAFADQGWIGQSYLKCRMVNASRCCYRSWVAKCRWLCQAISR